MKTLYNKTSKFRSEVVDKIADASIQLVNLSQQLKKGNDASEIKSIKEKIQKVKDDRAKAMSKMKAYEEFFNSNDSWSVAEDVVNSVNSSTIKAFNNKTEIIKQNLQLPAIKIENFKTKEEPSTPDSEKRMVITMKEMEVIVLQILHLQIRMIKLLPLHHPQNLIFIKD